MLRDAHVTSRSCVVWHVLEHALHHGGEISLALGLHGQQAHSYKVPPLFAFL